MKLKYAGFATVAAILFSSQSANANLLFDIYGGVAVGAGGMAIFADNDNHSDSAQSYGAVVGIDIPVLRFELEYDYLTNPDSDIHLGMLNAYFKMPSTVIHPYAGVGVGSAFSGNLYNTDINTVAAYQGMLGVTFDVPALPIKIDAEGRALYAPNVYEIENIKPDILQYDLRVKLRYVF